MKCSIKIPQDIIDTNCDKLIDIASKIEGIIAFQLVNNKNQINIVFDENLVSESKIRFEFEDLYFTLEQ